LGLSILPNWYRLILVIFPSSPPVRQFFVLPMCVV
jgi:hypothetical protein